ncbi:Ribonuclease H domain [Sesbania bispinosa]|nr:Ribonuclease H domain [Sesbania bispinosa]
MGVPLGIPGGAGFGGVLRDSSGAWIRGFYGNIGFSEILQAELLAILHGLHIAWREGYRFIRCSTDSQFALNLICKPDSPFHKYASILSEIKGWSLRDWVSFHHIHREGNQVADFLAKKGALASDRLTELVSPLQELATSLLADALGIAFPRM